MIRVGRFHESRAHCKKCVIFVMAICYEETRIMRRSGDLVCEYVTSLSLSLCIGMGLVAELWRDGAVLFFFSFATFWREIVKGKRLLVRTRFHAATNARLSFVSLITVLIITLNRVETCYKCLTRAVPVRAPPRIYTRRRYLYINVCKIYLPSVVACKGDVEFRWCFIHLINYKFCFFHTFFQLFSIHFNIERQNDILPKVTFIVFQIANNCHSRGIIEKFVIMSCHVNILEYYYTVNIAN